MRNNNSNIKINSLEEKKARKKLHDFPENCAAMIKKYNKRIAGIELKTVVADSKTQFLVPKDRDPNEVIKRYRDSRKYK